MHLFRVAIIFALIGTLLVGPGLPAAQASPVAPSDSIERAVRFAESQVGKPYRWGATGPSSYDCSGLVYRAYALREGWNLPRSSLQMSRATGTTFRTGPGTPWRLRRGDLLFLSWRADRRIHHVGIYLGNGRMVDTSGSLRRVVERDVMYGALVEARRIRPSLR